ncbi:MAG: class II aldolase/adducin family protein [Armatimonadetes bacterium]|nr:class II aldolase/adducin family protein [Armatimonadota bacterium]
MPEEGQLRRDLCEIGRRMWLQGLVAATDGNFSVRLSEDRLLATPTGVNKGFMSPEEIVKIDLGGQPVEGFTRPSSEIRMHLAIYERRPDVCAVVHGHPPTATGFAAVRVPVPTEILTEAHTFLGPVAVVEYATPGSATLPQALARHVKEHNLFLLANHGAVAVGGDLFQASYRMEALEQSARIAITARLLGGAQAIEASELEKLQAIRGQLGLLPSEESCLAAGEACGGAAPDDEVLIARITSLVLDELQRQGR